MAFENPYDAPKAHSTKWYKCGSCEHLHIVLRDENEDAIATAVLSFEMLMSMIEAISEELETIQ